MILKRISILNYKNLEQAELEFSPKMNCFIGQNGMGKTNLLDAVYYLSFCKSATNPIDSQNIRHEGDFFVIQGFYETNQGDPEEVAHIVVEEGVKVVTTGAGNPGKYMEMWKAAGIKVVPVVASVALAKMMEKAGADAVVAEGTESGGHIGSATTMTLVPQVVDAVEIPVIAAGGIADGRGFAAAMMLGAEAVQIGTRFCVAAECICHENYKQKIIKAKDIDSEVTGRSNGHPIRCLRNQMSREYLRLEKEGAGFEELERLTVGSLRNAVIDGDVKNGTVMAGQIAGLIKKEQSCKELWKKLWSRQRN